MRNFPKLFFKLNFWIIFLIAVQLTAIIFLCLYIPSFLPLTLVLVLVYALSAATATLLFVRKGAPEVKCVWFVIIAAIPVAGALIYLFASGGKREYGILKVNNAEAGFKAFSGLSGAANKTCGTCAASYDKTIYFSCGAEFLTSAISAIKSAKKNVYIEFFIFARGYILNALLQAITQAKNNGAEVKIIIDGVGSALKINGKDYKNLKKAGAEVKVFHKLNPFPHPRINFRDHRKILTVDGKVAFTGGINIADEYANITNPFGFWKDTGVAVYGDAAKIFEGMFLAMWSGRHEMTAPEITGNKLCLPFCDSPPTVAFGEDAFVNAINSAKLRVHILTPYFCVSDKTYSALTFAAKRGVEVKVIIPHVPDKKYAFEVSKAFAGSVSEHGVEFYEYTPGFMHAKTVICDSTVFIGSYNFDYRSTRFNYECGVAFEGEICETIERDFENCLALSSKIVEKRPSLPKKIYRFFLKFFAPLV